MLIGNSKHEVEELLGLEFNDLESDKWIYFAGLINNNPVLLFIIFENDEVVKAELYET